MSNKILFPTLVRPSSSEAKFDSNRNNNNDDDEEEDERKMQILPTASPVIDVRLTAKRRKKHLHPNQQRVLSQFRELVRTSAVES